MLVALKSASVLAAQFAYSAVGLVFRATSGRNKGPIRFSSQSWGKVAVVGRGESALALIGCAEDFDVVIVCNFRSTDLENTELMGSLSRAKSLWILANIEEPTIGFFRARQLPIDEVIWLGFPTTRIDHKSGGRRRAKGALNKYGLPVRTLPREFDARWIQGFGKNTGVAAAALASLRSGDVSLFGIEFYSGPFLKVTNHDTTGFGFTRPDYGLAAKSRFLELTQIQNHVTFRLFGNNHGLESRHNLLIEKV